jgi:hypothetical protein
LISIVNKRFESIFVPPPGGIGMSDQVTKEIELEIAHILFIDTVGYSKLSINEQRAVVDELPAILRTPNVATDFATIRGPRGSIALPPTRLQ